MSSPPTWTTVASPFGVWPSTVAPVRTSIPRLLNDRATTATTSASQPGRSLGSASSTVTSVPRSLIIDANSQPMAPPPITTARAGSESSDSTSSDVSTKRPSISNPGIVRGTEPLARMTWRPWSCDPPSTLTTLPGPNVPVPSTVVILRLFIRP